jgi:hypothetical protein
MRSHRSRGWWRGWALVTLTLALLLVPQLAMAQVSIDPTATPESHDGGWIYWMAQGSIVLGVLVLLLAGAAYLRFAPRFFRSDREEEAKRTAVPAPPANAIRIQYEAPEPVAQPEPAAVGAPAAGGGTSEATATAPAPAAAAPAAQPAATAPAAAAPAAAATPAAAPRPATPKQEGPLELDQETFDRVLQEQLDKGTDRRVAEGRARSAAVKAAREKAGG